ncbi:MAG: hypothetical protein CVU42_15955 [Chloroflexi bacterium HGW-Chloroflexi-4]|jgi:uncharacterized protein YvpB|nr:MAG: hypothetical protein CVU42_15955 [Chloroflexi bacterium HGW-Chloroflexi-4]
MKQNRIVNILFFCIIGVLLVLAVIGSMRKPIADQDISQELTPTIDVAGSVEQTLQAFQLATEQSRPTETQLVPTNTIPPPTSTPVVIPAEFYITDFLGHKQYYSIGCEASAAVDLAGYYDIPILQYDFQMALPKSDNPDLGFVGDVTSPWGQIPPYAYGVHADPVAQVLNQYGLAVEGGKDYSLEQIKEKLAQSKPVIVWVIGKMVYSEPVVYTNKAGNKSIVAPYEHVVILTGYNETSVRYVSNGNWADVEYSIFLNSWGVLGNMAVMPK